jgi:2-amino-4-hydroxy-6-hydroxymethyldihydropteridine diphosphokinase
MRGYISIGSNIDKELHISASLHALQQLFGELTVSSIYESAAVGFVGDSFHNLVVGFDSDLEVKTIAKQLRQIELDNGRTRDSQKFSARTLDLDLILFGDLVVQDGRLQLPRDEIERYAFVLEPLAEIAPNSKHPVTGKTYAELWQAFDKSQVKQHKL